MKTTRTLRPGRTSGISSPLDYRGRGLAHGLLTATCHGPKEPDQDCVDQVGPEHQVYLSVCLYSFCCSSPGVDPYGAVPWLNLKTSTVIDQTHFFKH